MNPRRESRAKTIKFLENESKSLWLCARQWFLIYDIKVQAKKKKNKQQKKK